MKEGTAMVKNNKTVLIAKNLQDVFYHLKSVNGLQIFGGGTNGELMEDKSITVRNIPELRQIEKHERFIDFGAAVTLSEILSLGKTNMPLILYEAIKTIGTMPVRNIATLGGNICARGNYHTLWAPLIALDARLEVRNAGETRYIPFSHFTGVPKGFVLTKVRVPVDDWEVEIFKRVGPSHEMSPLSAGFAFLVDTQKDMIANIRIAFAGKVVFRPRDLENKIIGTRLPLSDKFINNLVQEAEERMEIEQEQFNVPQILKSQFLSLLRSSLEQLT